MIKLKKLLKEWNDTSFKDLPKRWSKPIDIFREETLDGLTELERLNEMIKPGDVFQDYYKKGVEIAIEKSMGKWRTVSFDLKTMSAHEVGVNNTLEKQKSMKLSSSDKMKIKKIVKDPQEADYINQDDSNMAKKLLRVLR